MVSVFDFRATCFMPTPFIEVALKQAQDPFSKLVARKIKYPHPRSEVATHLLSASGPLVQYGLKPVGPHSFLDLITTLSLIFFHHRSALPSGVSPKINTG